MYFAPGSHMNEVKKRFVRTTNGGVGFEIMDETVQEPADDE
jgi:hypothetical protein